MNKLSLWVLTGLLAVTTVFFNGYIVLASLRSYRHNRKWSPSETIVVALAGAAAGHQLLSYFWMTMDELDSWCRLADLPYAVTLLLVYSLKFTVTWDTAFLTFYYSTKLVTTPNRCYARIQAAILKHVSLAAVLIPACGLGTCMPMLAVFHADNFTAANRDCGVLMPHNTSGEVYEIMYLILADVLPGVVMAKCCVSISVHLGVHLRRMRASTNGARGPKLGSQMRVIRMALSLVAVFALFLAIDLYVNYQISVNHESVSALTFFFTSVYTSVVAVVLIYGKKTFWKDLIREFNVFMDEYPCLTHLKVSEQKPKT